MVELDAKMQCLNILKMQLNKRFITVAIKITQILEFIMLRRFIVLKK